MIPETKHTALNILLADDDVDDRFFFDKALKELPIDCHLKTVSNGEELMDYLIQLSSRLPDILFLDLSMPRKTGFECLIEIKENQQLRNLYIVMFTTSFTRGFEYEQNLINTLSNMGAQDYIRKPGDFGQFKKVIHQSLIKLMEIKSRKITAIIS
jgi:CheY-like chemotaxis protein